MLNKRFSGIAIVMLIFGLILWGAPAMAKVSGPCSDCHTMHNSQDGDYDYTITGTQLTSGPYGALTKGDCVGCHTSATGAGNTGSNTIPYVNHALAPTYGTNTLAGGSFYYGAVDDNCIHNVKDIAGKDSNIDSYVPPGYGSGLAAKDGTTAGLGSWDTSEQLTCAGTYGCHGTHTADTDSWAAISGSHHAGASGLVLAATTAAKDGYRFLVGIKGYEDSDWEYQPDASNHNQYSGYTSNATALTNKDTISYLCAECHGVFHNTGTYNNTSPGSSPWIRHPTELDLSNATGSEYQYYNGNTSGAGTEADYSVIAPVASVIDGTSTVLSTVEMPADGSGDEAIVTCISCHRAHGTPYADLLRWDYSAMRAHEGEGNVGCFICHTTKDDI